MFATWIVNNNYLPLIFNPNASNWHFFLPEKMIFLLNPINYSLKSLPLFSIQLSFSLSTLKLSSNLLHFIILIIINFLILTNQQDEKTFVQTNSVINIDNHVIDLCQQDCSQRIVSSSSSSLFLIFIYSIFNLFTRHNKHPLV